MASPLVATSPAGRVVTVCPQGEVDLAMAPALRDALAEACALDAPLIVLDMARVTFADSTALGLMIAAHKRLAADGRRLVTVNVPAMLAKALRVTGLLVVLDVWAPDGLLLGSAR